MLFCNIIVLIKFVNGHNSFSAAIRNSRENVPSHFRNHHLQVIIAQIAGAPTPRPSLKHVLKQHFQNVYSWFFDQPFIPEWGWLLWHCGMEPVINSYTWDSYTLGSTLHFALVFLYINIIYAPFTTFTGVTTHRPHTEKTPAMHWEFDALGLSFGTVGWQRGEMGLGAGCATHSLGFLLIPESIAGLPPICLTPCNMGCGKRCEVSEEIS